MKDKTESFSIAEFVGLNSKMNSYIKEEKENDIGDKIKTLLEI